ncbi:hypothetical protein BSPWISOXPB_6034 [uncultured Gammaproteobacteria bacterium]|jgi:hypothetical protein|nr:hypothetical protein BSPWISOXPB_6034 [uncultured Gammaproteobacteria bacterium]
MTLTNFKLSTLISVTLLTFSLNVFSAGICMPGEEELPDGTLTQEEVASQYKDALNDGTLPESDDAYSDIAMDNIDSLSSSSELDIAAATGEIMDASESVVETSMMSAEMLTSAAGEIFGAATIALTITLSTWQIIEAFANPDSTDLDKAVALFSWNPVIGTILQIINQHAHFLATERKINALNFLDHYKFSTTEEDTLKSILAKIRPALESVVAQDMASVKEIMIESNAKIGRYYQSEYLRNVDILQTHLKQFFAAKWIKGSPIFIELVDFMNKSNNVENVVNTVIQDDQWHFLADNGRTDDISVMSLDKFVYSESNNENTLLNTNVFAIESFVLDNTWIIGGINDPEGHLVKAAHYLVVTLRNTPNQDQGVEYNAYSIFNLDNFAALVNTLTTTKDFANAGWTVTTTSYTATGIKVPLVRADVAIPSIISQKTITFCGINNNNNVDFLQGKGIKRMSKCLDGIFWDYKNHFAAYNLDHIIQVDARNDKTINTTLQEFLQSYGQSYNHLLAQTKISTINKFYKEKEPINLQICQVYYNNAKKVLSYADEQMTRAAKNAFQRDNNLNNQGQSLESSCWRRDCLESTPMGKVFGGKCIRWSPEKYMCDVVTYVPKKDSELDLTKNIIHQQVEDDRQNCLKKRDDAPIIFARQLTAQGYFYLDKNDSRVLFEEIFEGIRASLMKRFTKDVLMSQSPKDQNTP